MTDPVLFYSHRNGPFRSFSNWYDASFEYKGQRWVHTEQAYMYFKSDDPEYRRQIRRTTDPGEVKRLGRNVTLRPGWDDMKFTIMVEVNLAKFTQNADLRELLLSTDDRAIHEDCNDPWWGGGPRFPRGRDLLGKVLIEVRRRIREGGPDMIYVG